MGIDTKIIVGALLSLFFCFEYIANSYVYNVEKVIDELMETLEEDRKNLCDMY